MIYRIKSEWEELNELWIRADEKAQAIGYLLSKNSEYTFSLNEISGLPMSEPDFDATKFKNYETDEDGNYIY